MSAGRRSNLRVAGFCVALLATSTTRQAQFRRLLLKKLPNHFVRQVVGKGRAVRILGIEVEENTPGGFPTMASIAVVMMPVFAIAWAIGYVLIDWLELVGLTEAQSRNGYRDVFRGVVGLAVIAVPALFFQFRETLHHL